MECVKCGGDLVDVSTRYAQRFICPDCEAGLRGGQGRTGGDTFRLGEALVVLAVVAALLLGVVWALAQRDPKPMEPVVGGRP